MHLSKTIRWILIGLACPVVLLALFYAEEDWRGWHAWHKFQQQWEAKGEKFDLASIVPAPVPDDQNFALTPIVASCYGQILDSTGREIKPRNTNLVNRLQMSCQRNADTRNPPAVGSWQKATFTDLNPWQQYYRNLNRNDPDGFPVAAEPQTPAADVLLALSKYDPEIEELRQAGQLPLSRFPLEYGKDDPSAILLPHLAALKRCSQVLQLRAIAELQNGQNDKAFEDVKLMLRLTDSVSTEPFLISHLVRLAILQITLQPIWEGMAEHQWTDAQLAGLTRELGRLDFVADYRTSMHGEMGFQDGILQYVKRHPKEYFNLMNGSGGNNNKSGTQTILAACLTLHLIPSGWFYQNHLNCARAMEDYYLPVADIQQKTIAPARARRADAAVAKECRHPGRNNILESLMIQGLGGSARRFATGQGIADLARVASALERYRLETGVYPSTLDALTPRLIEELPHDVISGGPLNYRLTADGKFVLYSVGWNERDDGGVAAVSKNGTVDLNNGDWVWR